MIPISKIDPELKIYKDKIVVIFMGGGDMELSENISRLLKVLNIKVDYFCDNNPNKWDKEVDGIRVISPYRLIRLQSKESEKDVLVHLALEQEIESKVKEEIEKIGISNLICYEEAINVLGYYIKCDKYRKSPELLKLKNELGSEFVNERKLILFDSFMGKQKDFDIFVCMVGKTGDSTIQKTFEKNNINSIFTHYPSQLNLNYFPKDKKIKIITAVREPLSRTLSAMFEIISKLGKSFLYDSFYKKEIIDVQTFVDAMLNPNIEMQKHDCNRFNIKHNKDIVKSSRVELFFKSFEENIIDVLRYPFDKEVGFSIIKEGNIEVFVYQLEKLNGIIPELSEWAGVSFNTLENSNLASEKWIADIYNRAKSEIRFSEEFFNISYNDPYIRHFYSEVDIEGFKSKWKNNIRIK